jgi:hypothetical protein
MRLLFVQFQSEGPSCLFPFFGKAQFSVPSVLTITGVDASCLRSHNNRNG